MQQLPPDAYVAMSYAWGPPEPTREIMVNGRIVVVRANLEAGLREFRKLDYFRLGGKIWVDSLCINQADDTEKGKQIPMMASIYCNAANIIVWLGPEESGSDLAISFLEHISASYRTEYLEALDKSDPLTATTWRTVAQVIMETNYKKFREVFYDSDMAVDLYNFFDRPYWRRLWIIQEVCMGRAGMPIVCGSRVTQWRYIRDGALICTAVLDILRELTVESIMRQCRAAMVGEHSLLHVAQIAQLEINGHRLELPKLPPDVAPILAPTMYEHGPLLGLPIRRAITLAAQSACWKQHDRIYGMLSIPGLPDLDIQVDYSRDVVDVFTEFTVACVRHGSLDFFAILDGGHMSRTDEHGNPQPRTKPSWVPDYGAKPGRKIGVIDGEWNAGGYVPISWGHLEVVDQTLVCTGKVVDMVDGVGAMSTADIETGSMILADEDPFPKMIQPSGTGAAPKDGGEAVIYDVLVAGCDIHAYLVDEPPKHSTLYRNWHFLKSSADYLVNGCPLSSYFTHLAKTAAARQAMEARTKMRRLLTTTSGLLGLAPLQSQPGDAVIAIVGHSKPVIARKVATVEGQDIWYLIGEAYIHGMMRAQKLPKRAVSRPLMAAPHNVCQSLYLVWW
ncbi:HET-domain-containing protein [Parathielavia appendiculata]|uniref:HET-domain-containing protein n=1 Tax=Parathielavia appendiculata TaxID=2587402 RepID=A0AAN6TPF6_9PEZI|nr:HET-domain-containing protein [Parathielavia appendiculata]